MSGFGKSGHIYYEIMYWYNYILNSVVYSFCLLCCFNLSGLQGLFSCFEGVCWVDDDVDGPGRASDDVVGIDGGVVGEVIKPGLDSGLEWNLESLHTRTRML